MVSIRFVNTLICYIKNVSFLNTLICKSLRKIILSKNVLVKFKAQPSRIEVSESIYRTTSGTITTSPIESSVQIRKNKRKHHFIQEPANAESKKTYRNS
jgi:hypothetical protein